MVSRSDSELVALANQLLTGGKGPYKDPRYFDDTFYDVDWMTKGKGDLVIQNEILENMLLPLKGQKPETLLMVGVHGIGKSFFARKAAGVAQKVYEGGGKILEVVYVDCKTYTTHYDIMVYLHKKLGVGHEWNPKTVVEGLEGRVREGSYFLIILDDVNCVRVGGKHKDKTIDNVLADLYGVNVGGGALTICAVTNDIHFESRLSSLNSSTSTRTDSTITSLAMPA